MIDLGRAPMNHDLKNIQGLDLVPLLPLLCMRPEPILTHLSVPVPRLQSNLLVFHSQVYPQDTLPCPGLSPLA